MSDAVVGQDGLVDVVARLVGFGRSIAKRFSAHRTSLAAGGMASFVTMAIAPAAIAFGAIIGLIWTGPEIRKALSAVFTGISTSDAQGELIEAISDLIETSSGGAVTISTIVGFLLAVYSASKVVRGGRYAFDAAFGLPPRTSGVIGFVSAAIITLAALVIAAAAAIVLAFVPRILEAMQIHYGGLLRVVHIGAIVVLSYVGLVLLYRVAARRSAAIGWVSTGALFAWVWVAAVTVGIGWFANPSGALGATMIIFGAPIILVFWSYFSFLGVLIGSELEAELAQRGGLRTVLTTDTSALAFVPPTPAAFEATQAQRH